jgi:hypothetical protein
VFVVGLNASDPNAMLSDFLPRHGLFWVAPVKTQLAVANTIAEFQRIAALPIQGQGGMVRPTKRQSY